MGRWGGRDGLWVGDFRFDSTYNLYLLYISNMTVALVKKKKKKKVE